MYYGGNVISISVLGWDLLSSSFTALLAGRSWWCSKVSYTVVSQLHAAVRKEWLLPSPLWRGFDKTFITGSTPAGRGNS